MFQFPRCPPDGLCIQPPVPALPRGRVAPFGFGRLIARLQLPVHVSPRAASFLGPWPLGIHPTPCLAWQLLLRINQAFARRCRADHPHDVNMFRHAVTRSEAHTLASAKLKETL